MFRYSSGYFVGYQRSNSEGQPGGICTNPRRGPLFALWPPGGSCTHLNSKLYHLTAAHYNKFNHCTKSQRPKVTAFRILNCDWVQHIHQSLQHDCWHNGVSQSARRAYKSHVNTDICNFNAGAGLHSPLHIYQMEKQLNKCRLGSLFFQLG